MNLAEYLARKQLIQTTSRKRELCPRCLQPRFSCYCADLRPFDSGVEFVILIHPIEAHRRIATGRMSHLMLRNSHLIMGQDYSHHPEVNRLLSLPNREPFVLYPGPQSTNLSEIPRHERPAVFKSGSKPLVFVIDGTWATAKKMMRQSQNLNQLPRVCFTPDRPSRFRVRKQPAAHCYSTIEAIHHFLDLYLDPEITAQTDRPHDSLLEVFDAMVERQLEFIRRSQENPRANCYRRPRWKPLPPEPTSEVPAT